MKKGQSRVVIEAKPAAGREYACGTITHSCLRWTIGILALAALLTLIPLVIFFWSGTDNYIATERFLVNLPTAVTPLAARVQGMIQMNTNSRTAPVAWNLLMDLNATGPVLAIGIYGPILENTLWSGPLLFALCGSPSTLVCTLNNTIVQGEPGGFPLNYLISAVRAYPYAYYYNISTTLAGDLTGTLGVSSGHA
jgi:hypothetical protein